jgi:hypothetical protein
MKCNICVFLFTMQDCLGSNRIKPKRTACFEDMNALSVQDFDQLLDPALDDLFRQGKFSMAGEATYRLIHTAHSFLIASIYTGITI